MLIVMLEEFAQLQEGFTEFFCKFRCLHDGDNLVLSA